eukprot:COSAG05_NODE_205_length_14184_cov_81.700887_13_plen_317_part_00
MPVTLRCVARATALLLLLALFAGSGRADEDFYKLAHPPAKKAKGAGKKAKPMPAKTRKPSAAGNPFFDSPGGALSKGAAGKLDNSSGWFPPPVSVRTKDEPHPSAAQPGVEHIQQPFDPDKLATVNAFDPRQKLMDEIRAQTRGSHGLRKAKVTVVSWEPRLVVVDDFMTSAEADQMVKATNIDFLGSTAVVTTEGSAEVLENTVTSHIGSFDDSETVDEMLARIAQLSFIPTDWSEPLHVLHYSPGEYFRAHLDVHAKHGRHTSSRIATAFLYLLHPFTPSLLPVDRVAGASKLTGIFRRCPLESITVHSAGWQR